MALSGDAGKVAITPKGVYDEETDYEILDMVTHYGNCYIAIVDVEKGNPPVITVDGEETVNTAYWFKCTDDQTAENAAAAAKSAAAAATSATSAATSASTATDAITTISNYASSASNAAEDAATSETNASTSADNAAKSASNASTYASNASTSADNAAKSASNAARSETNASGYSAAAANNATAAASNADAAEAWAVGTIDGEDVGSDADQYHNNAKYYAEQAGQAANDFVAPVEGSSTSSKDYSTGDQLIYNSVLYTVTADIAAGDTLEDGTNITASDTITEQIAATNSAVETLDSEKMDSYDTDPTAWDTAPTTGSTKPVTSGGVATAVTAVKTLVVTLSSISSLSTTFSNSAITSTMVVINSVLSNPSAQTGDWTVTTSDGSVTIAGSISGTTGITLYLAEAM